MASRRPCVCCEDHYKQVALEMSEQDLSRFLHKVNQLQQLVHSLEADAQRRDAMAACTNHNEVVALARSWGFEIARRWGTGDPFDIHNNLLQEDLPASGRESERILLQQDQWWLTLINSNEASTPPGEWMSQRPSNGFCCCGAVRAFVVTTPGEIDLSVGDHWFCPPYRRHRVERTDPPRELWLALHWRA